jgi:three-Cys-motif partner protein
VPARPWGFWTEQKLDVLSEYLSAFTVASSKKARGVTVYLDLFAGRAENEARDTGKRIEGSPMRALRVEPPLSTLRFFELPANAAKLSRELDAEFGHRDQRVVAGDCNQTINDVLAELVRHDLNWAPTFAFIDQQGPDVLWETLERLADHKKGRPYKVELWMFFGNGLLPRGLGIRSPDETFARRVDRMLGTTAWREAYNARRSGDLSPEDFRDELVNWARWRLEQTLGYAYTHTFELRNVAGVPIYAMVFATDNAAGNRIMGGLYGKAVRQHPLMRADAQARRRAKQEAESGRLALFDMPAQVTEEELYEHTPPHLPYGLDRYDVQDPDDPTDAFPRPTR